MSTLIFHTKRKLADNAYIFFYSIKVLNSGLLLVAVHFKTWYYYLYLSEGSEYFFHHWLKLYCTTL